MESLPKITDRVRLPLAIKVPPYLLDHQFQGKAVLPAVEAMEILAASTLAHLPGTAVHCIRDAGFDKFLVISEGCDALNAYNDLEVLDNGTVISRLITKTRSKKAMITRTLEHATLCFQGVSIASEAPPLEIPAFSDPSSSKYHISVETIYKSLVPFGPHYHNLKDGVTISEEDAMGRVYAPSWGAAPAGLLGSPFPLDAAFHAACVWGQRYAGLVGFPVGFGLRRLFAPTRSGSTHTARIFPKKVHPDRFLADIWITDMDGALQEAVLDVVMRDVSGGRIKPPSWIVSDAAEGKGSDTKY
ncbi:MAG: polyketide synthase dehydratase domain-containing protein [Deltaproteobacteria bacterium]|nr:polyketide synthase dehydratase domain-containing protein [Deltaproteobacteria bacterium]